MPRRARSPRVPAGRPPAARPSFQVPDPGQRRRFARDGEDGIEVHLGCDPGRDPVHARARGVGFVARDEAQVAFDDRHALVLVHGAQHRHVGVMLDHGAQLGFVARAAQPVQYHARDANFAVEGLVAQDQRRDAAGHAARIDHQHHRRAQQRGDARHCCCCPRGRGRRTVPCCLPRRRSIAPCMRRANSCAVPARRSGKIEVVARPPGRQAEPQRVDVVGPLLERLHRLAARAQGGAQADAYRRLARRLMRGRDREDGSRRAGVGCRRRSGCPGAGSGRRVEGAADAMSASGERHSAQRRAAPRAGSARKVATTPSKKLLLTSLPGNSICGYAWPPMMVTYIWARPPAITQARRGDDAARGGLRRERTGDTSGSDAAQQDLADPESSGVHAAIDQDKALHVVASA